MAKGNNALVSKLAVSDLKKAAKKISPDPTDLIRIGTIENTKKRNKNLEKLGKGLNSKLRAESKAAWDKGVNTIVEKAFKEQALKLKKSGVNLSRREINDLKDEAIELYRRKKYFGAKPEQRFDRVAKRAADEIVRDTRKLRTSVKPEFDSERALRRMGSKHRGFSFERSSKKLMVSEVHRAQAEAIGYLSQSIGAGYLRWVTMQDARVTLMDRERGRGGDLSPQEKRALTLQKISTKGVWHPASALALERHVNCRCTLDIVQGEALELAEVYQGRKDEVLANFAGQNLAGGKSDELLKNYLNTRIKFKSFTPVKPSSLKKRKASFKKAIEDNSLRPLAFADRAFMTQTVKGQIRGIQDLAQVLGKKIDPETIKELGVENSVRILLKNVPINVSKKLLKSLEILKRLELQNLKKSLKRT